MHRDQHGLEMTAANDAAVRHYDETLLHFMGLRQDTGDRLAEAFEADPDMPMAHCARGYFMKLFCTPPLERKAEESLAKAKTLVEKGATERERQHVAALGAWCRGDIRGATDIWESILLAHPRDVLAMRMAHFTHFYMGDAASLRDSVARVLPYWHADMPGYGFIIGYHAFGLEESGDYKGAERLGRAAVEINEADIWSTHAVAHVMEMQGRYRDGITWLAGLCENWEECNNFRYHTWWHKCLFHLELEQFDEILYLYDHEVRADTSSADYLDMSNAIALLWRLQEAGAYIGDRWQELAEKAADKVEDNIFAFHDAHYAMALAAGGRRDDVATLIRNMGKAATREDTTEAPIYRDVGIPLCRAIDAYGAGDHAAVVDHLLPVRRQIYRIGGSHAQRDLFFRLLVVSALHTRQFRLARALLAERNALNPNSVWGLKRVAVALEGLGDSAEAAKARQRADKLLAA